ncbi:MAG: nucleotidyl transferase AbiEii/AbiGii toxin family protein [Phycisphaerae bacterium]
MNEVVAVRQALLALNASGIPYAFSGSLASNFYAVARSTKDADFVVQTDAVSLARLFDSLQDRFDSDRQPSFEMVTHTTRYVLDHRDTAFKIELFLLSDDPFDHSRFARRRLDSYEDIPVWVMSPEDVVVQKLRRLKLSRNPKHREDVRRVFAFSGDGLDMLYVYRWADTHGTRALLEEIRAEVERSRPPGDAG